MFMKYIKKNVVIDRLIDSFIVGHDYLFSLYVLSLLDDRYIDSDRFTDNGEAIRCTNAPILTDGTYRDNKTDDGDGYHGNLTSLNEYKLEKFMEFKYTNIYGYAEDYVVFKANGFFTKLKDNTRVRISIKVDD